MPGMPASLITLIAPIPAAQATDYGIAAPSNVAGGIVSIDQQNAENLVHQGLASFGSVVRDNAMEIAATRELIRLQTVAAAATVAAGAYLRGPNIDLGEEHNWDNIRVFAVADQAGTVAVEHSLDGINFFTIVAATALVAGTAVVVEERVAARFVRLAFHNTAASAAVAVHAGLNLTHLNAAV